MLKICFGGGGGGGLRRGGSSETYVGKRRVSFIFFVIAKINFLFSVEFMDRCP